MDKTAERSLVIMANGDVYYIGQGDSETLLEVLHTQQFEAFGFVDIKSGATVTVHLRHVSSVVREADRG